VRLLLDEMWSPAIADQLRRRGHDVEAVAERDNLRTRPDHLIFAAALADDRAIVTEDVRGFRDLGELELLSGRSHPGLIFTTPSTFPRPNMRTPGRLVRALDALLRSETELRNREIWLTPP